MSQDYLVIFCSLNVMIDSEHINSGAVDKILYIVDYKIQVWFDFDGFNILQFELGYLYDSCL